MKAAIFISALFIVSVTVSSSFAKIWRVDNNTANSADFRTIQNAHDRATAGDTIYVAGSGAQYSGFTVTKKLSFFGPGYFLDENPNTQARPISAEINSTIQFNQGSEGSIISGFKIAVASINLDAKNIMIKRNHIIGSVYIGTPSSSAASNSIITQNYITGVTGIYIDAGIQNIMISNNYLDFSSYAIAMVQTGSAEIFNNVINGNITIYNAVLRNNILKDGGVSGTGNTFQNNLGNTTQFGSSNGNKSSVAMSSVFIGSGSTDGKWQLKSDSPAIGAGTDGADCGMFGGLSPYVLSGIPNLPRIYYFSAPLSGSGSAGLRVRIKAKSGN